MAEKLLAPIHPGEVLREEFMLPMELSSHAVARAIGVTPARVNDIVNQKRGITADTALRLGRYFGTTADVWINLRSGMSWKRHAANWAMPSPASSHALRNGLSESLIELLTAMLNLAKVPTLAEP